MTAAQKAARWYQIAAAAIDVAALAMKLVPFTDEDRAQLRSLAAVPPSERPPNEHRRALDLSERNRLAEVYNQAHAFKISLENAIGHQPGIQCTGRTPAGGYCLCELGIDLRIVETRSNDQKENNTEEATGRGPHVEACDEESRGRGAAQTQQEQETQNNAA